MLYANTKHTTQTIKEAFLTSQLRLWPPLAAQGLGLPAQRGCAAGTAAPPVEPRTPSSHLTQLLMHLTETGNPFSGTPFAF